MQGKNTCLFIEGQYGAAGLVHQKFHAIGNKQFLCPLFQGFKIMWVRGSAGNNEESIGNSVFEYGKCFQRQVMPFAWFQYPDTEYVRSCAWCCWHVGKFFTKQA